MTQPILLTDAQMRQFITEGYLLLHADFAPEFHAAVQANLNEVYQNEGNPGNNILPRIPELQSVFDHPVVQGALTSVLGEGYMMHPHRHGHFNKQAEAGGWHKDSYWGHQKVRNHRPWWAMIFYFPQDVSVEMGPTGIMPGTQTYQSRVFDRDETAEEVKSAGPAGTLAIVHYDIWHRATANISGKDRYMLKFQFMRTAIPVEASWNHTEAEWSTPAELSAAVQQHEVVWRDIWNWLTGNSSAGTTEAVADRDAAQAAKWMQELQSEDQTVRAKAADELGLLGAAAQAAAPLLAQQLEAGYEPLALNAAYALGRMGERGIAELLQALSHPTKAVSRAAGYGLSIAGKAAVQGLIEQVTQQPSVNAANHAAFALGEIGAEAAEAVPALAALHSHADENVRRTAVESLGMIGTPHEAVVAGLERGLKDADSQVRFNAATALARLGSKAEHAVPAIEQALQDENRYVRATAAEALYYVGTEKAKNALLKFLRTARWCATTTPQNTF
ncbi:HEAT repeat domain-containing protein [Paenibacillus thalictri]|uniref:Phytanoyl-CoA dioxygenase n=1 Tax=Paenibacillus thalictri TaxID=2527873 RepID=A0A4Q9DRN4_9BACL|nr:HEAT repeat domain-containing protein [Paenibacillus thalictri]TBL77817.1 phytanoyl-CoA dioxygenase [Paenibacillus thalictri]